VKARRTRGYNNNRYLDGQPINAFAKGVTISDRLLISLDDLQKTRIDDSMVEAAYEAQRATALQRILAKWGGDGHSLPPSPRRKVDLAPALACLLLTRRRTATETRTKKKPPTHWAGSLKEWWARQGSNL
jgi:hypothetical protein